MNKISAWTLLLFFTAHSVGYAMCVEPSVPNCVSIKETYQEEELFYTCKKSFLDYIVDMKEFSVCQNDEFTAIAQAVQDRVNKATENFNCMVEKKGEC